MGAPSCPPTQVTRMKKILNSALALLLLAGAASAVAEVRPNTPVPGAEDYPRGVEISRAYRVLVKSAGDPAPWNPERHSAAAYRFWPDYLDPETLPRKHANTAVHVAQFDADERVRLRVELIDGREIETLRLKPARYAEMAETRASGDNWVEFELEPYELTRHVLVEINAPRADSEALQDGLVVFLNPLSEIPEGKVLVLPEGVVDERWEHMDEINRIYITEDSPWDALYIPQNTIVDGRVDIRKEGFKVMGRGMIVGSRWPFVKSVPNWRARYPAWISPGGEYIRPILSYINPEGADQTKSHFEGVLVVHPYHFCVGWAWMNENLKTFGWRYSSDGVHGTHKRGIFTRVNDDAVYVNEGSVEDSTFWHMVNGAIFQFGWGLNRDNDREVHVRRNDVVRGEWDVRPDGGLGKLGAPDPKDIPPQEGPGSGANKGVFVGTYRSGGPYTVSNKHFEDIRVEFRANRLLFLGSKSGKVSYENITFRDVTFEVRPSYDGVENVLWGGGRIDGIVFEGFVVGGERLDGIEDLEPLLQQNVEQVEFR